MDTPSDVTPLLVVAGADQAIAYYQHALGAQLVERFTAPDDRVVHAELTIGAGRIAIKDEDVHDRAATTLGGSPVILQIEVADADAVAEALLAGGGTVVFPIADQPYGARQGRIADPYGFSWLISQQLEQLTDEEIQARLDEA